jgi:hypothetical protein
MDIDQLARVFDALCLEPEAGPKSLPLLLPPRPAPDSGPDGVDGSCLLACVTGDVDARLVRATRVSVYREPVTGEITATLLVLVDANHAQHCVAIARRSSTCPWGRDLGLVYDDGNANAPGRGHGSFVMRASSRQAVWFANRVLLPRLHRLRCAG